MGVGGILCLGKNGKEFELHMLGIIQGYCTQEVGGNKMSADKVVYSNKIPK